MPGADMRGHRLALSAVLITQALLFYTVSGMDAVPAARPLKACQTQFGPWNMVREGVMEKETLDVLRADDTLTRLYTRPASGAAASLFVAYFKTQRTGQAPHSPKNCLPGSGWTPSESAIISMQVPGLAEPIEVNRYVVAKGDEQSLVLYWYQTRDRVVASEYRARVYMMADAIRYNRTDTALVRVVVPVVGNQVGEATKTAQDFVTAFFLRLRQHLPS